MLEEILFFSDESFEDYKRDEIFTKPSMAFLIKHNLSNVVDDVVTQMVYGNSRKPPGDENSAYQKLLLKKDVIDIPGIWIPLNAQCKALALKWIFPNVSAPYKSAESKVVPPYLIISYDAFKYKEVMELSKQFPEAVIKFGFFDSDIPGEAKLLTKTVDGFENRTSPPTYEEKLVAQVAKSNQWMSEFSEIGPSYMSPDTVIGAEDAKHFFPSSYDIPEEIIQEIKKKPKRKTKGKFATAVVAHEDELLQVDSETQNENQEMSDNQSEEQLNEEKTSEIDGDEDEETGDGEVEEADKATSPITDVNEEDSYKQ